MRIAGSNRLRGLNPKEKETLVWMAGERAVLVRDVEEGQISDSESVEEITEQDFVQEAGSRCWVKFPAAYGGSLASYAWFQGVQNKPLTEPYVRGQPRLEKSVKREDQKRLPTETVILDSGDEDEKEEGELEEGEIDGDTVVETTLEEIVSEADEGVGVESAQSESAKLKEDVELQKKIKSVEEAFQTVTENSADKSFRLICSETRSSLDTLQQLVLDKNAVAAELIQKAFAVVQLVHNVFCCGTSDQQQLHEDDLLRFLCHVKEKTRALFSQDQIEEVEAMIKSVVSDSCRTVTKDKTTKAANKQDNSSSIIFLESTAATLSSQKPVDYFNGIKSGGISSEALRHGPVLTRPKVRREFGRINLHVDYDENSLPSPTRDGPPTLPVLKPLNITDAVAPMNVGTSKEKETTEDDAFHPYVTDAVKAVSSYQQKFGHTSFLLSNRLPSPTPSEECNDEDGDSNGEVSSCCSSSNSKIVSSTLPSQQIGESAGPDIASVNGKETVPSRRPSLVGPGTSSILKPSAKSRDPRLRLVNPEMSHASESKKNLYVDSATNSIIGVLGTRKLTAIEDTTPSGNVLKKQRNGITNSSLPRDPRLSGGGGWLVDNNSREQPASRNQISEAMDVDTQKSQIADMTLNKSMDAGGNLNLPNIKNSMPVASVAPTVSLPSLLKDIAVNPTMLLQLIQMEQQRLASGTQQNSANMAPSSCPPSSSMLSTSASSGDNMSIMSTKLEHQPREKPQNLAQAASMNVGSDWGKVRMKPRDPRRILQNNIIQKSEGFESDQLKRNGVAKTDDTQGSGENVLVQTEAATCLPSISAALPDIGPQFTKTLKKVADIVSSPELASTSQPVLPNAPQSLAAQEVADRALESPNDQENRAKLMDEDKVSPEQQNPWGDEEKMFEGYDDEQKAVIQRERARRIEEQKKMFAARKLCLVLDLDHTLLNSAKFVEVDPVHEEILRKKEELDREKPYRHLFRFSHMGMWTKLRPGVWNFLEKASKLYELHLYTMGNKLYATEMAKVLDPTGVLFAGRVISRGDDGELFDGDERVPKSKDLDGVLGMESGVVIIDDSVRVWPHNKHNLILVERYTYFPCSRRQFGLLGPSLLEIDHDERPEDGTLASSLAVIERIHQNFFSHLSLDEVDVRSILSCEQRKILSGCRILFSRIFPVGEANPHLHPLWQTAEQFGAVCTTQIDDQVTHVVANSLGTDKVNWALSTGRFVVHPGWVEASALLYRRANERDFAVK